MLILKMKGDFAHLLPLMATCRQLNLKNSLIYEKSMISANLIDIFPVSLSEAYLSGYALCGNQYKISQAFTEVNIT